jgi:hypothetical protein
MAQQHVNKEIHTCTVSLVRGIMWLFGTSSGSPTPMRFIVVFLSPAMKIPREYLKLSHDHFLSYPFQFIIHLSNCLTLCSPI